MIGVAAERCQAKPHLADDRAVCAIRRSAMSALGQKQTLVHVRVMSALPPKADIDQSSRDVRFVPKADMGPVWLRAVFRH